MELIEKVCGDESVGCESGESKNEMIFRVRLGSISFDFFSLLNFPSCLYLAVLYLSSLVSFSSFSACVFVYSVTWFLLALAREHLSRGVYRSRCSLWLGGKPSYSPRRLSVRSITVRTVRLNRTTAPSLSRPCGLEGALLALGMQDKEVGRKRLLLFCSTSVSVLHACEK